MYSTAIVSVQWIQKKETFEYGGSCGMVWSNKKVYKGILICSGILKVAILANYGKCVLD